MTHGSCGSCHGVVVLFSVAARGLIWDQEMIQPAVYWDFLGLVNHLFAGPKITVTSDSCNHWSKRFHHQEGFFLGLNKAIISLESYPYRLAWIWFPFFLYKHRFENSFDLSVRKTKAHTQSGNAWCMVFFLRLHICRCDLIPTSYHLYHLPSVNTQGLFGKFWKGGFWSGSKSGIPNLHYIFLKESLVGGPSQLVSGW